LPTSFEKNVSPAAVGGATALPYSIKIAYVGQASRLTSEIKRPQARRPRYIPEAKINRLFA
jgi:hypothetical protein